LSGANPRRIRAAAGFLAVAFLAACGPIHEWPYVGENPHCTADFCVDLPGKGGASVKTSGNDTCAFIDLIDDSSLWYSVEWCSNKHLDNVDAAAFYKYWDAAQSGYLGGNFGEARYARISSAHVTLADGRPGIAFAGSGNHNGGKKGAIIVLATVADGHAATCYVLFDRQLPRDFDMLASTEYKSLLLVASSVRSKTAPKKSN
jgi:hypothetical protein